MKKFTKNLRNYIPLIGLLAAGFFGFWLFSFDRIFQTALIIAVSMGYVTWGIVNHKIHNDLTWVVILEYVAVSVFGVIVVLSIVFRA